MVGSTAKVVRNSVSIISHITFPDCPVHIFPTTFLEIAVYRTYGSVILYACLMIT